MDLNLRQELKQKYPLLNIIEDYPDGCSILFDKQQCQELIRMINYYESEIIQDRCREDMEGFLKQLQNYLKTKINP